MTQHDAHVRARAALLERVRVKYRLEAPRLRLKEALATAGRQQHRLAAWCAR